MPNKYFLYHWYTYYILLILYRFQINEKIITSNAKNKSNNPKHLTLVLIAITGHEGSVAYVQICWLPRDFATRIHKVWMERKAQTRL